MKEEKLFLVSIFGKTFVMTKETMQYLYYDGYVDCMLDNSLDQFRSFSDAYNCADLFDFHCEKEGEEKFTLQYELACMAVIIHGGGDGCD